mmetsp:Transcript_9707/g.35551  ORF Transcript_9707/g.35551 Transcript_9707/m.35551 type:complete len:268 (-) Transcript_9707:108-911(-)
MGQLRRLARTCGLAVATRRALGVCHAYPAAACVPGRVRSGAGLADSRDGSDQRRPPSLRPGLEHSPLGMYPRSAQAIFTEAAQFAAKGAGGGRGRAESSLWLAKSLSTTLEVGESPTGSQGELESESPGQGKGVGSSNRAASHTKHKALNKVAARILQGFEEREMKALVDRVGKFDDFKAGDILALKLIIPENRRKVASFKGICIARRNRGLGSSFTLRNVFNGMPIERQFPLYSPHLLEVKKVGSRRVRRAKLYYLRNLPNKFSTV